MKLTRDNGNTLSKKMVLIFPSIMTADLILKIVSISMRTGQIKIFIGTATLDFLL